MKIAARTRALYRVVETTVGADGRLLRTGRIWQPDLARTRRFGRVLAMNSAAQAVQVADEAGRVVETIPLPTAADEPRGWRDWRAQMAALPPLPPLPPAPPSPVRRRPLPPPPVLPVESAVEATRPLPPGSSQAASRPKS